MTADQNRTLLIELLNTIERQNYELLKIKREQVDFETAVKLRIETMEFETIDLKIFKLILEFFKGDIDKATFWLNTNNPNLGASPAKLMGMGRSQKLLNWIESIKGEVGW